jgi:hypothetical protein
MSNETKQTAVEWYIIKRDEIEMKIRLMLICANQYEQELTKADKQAKEMEKQQIINAFWNGDNTDCTSEQNIEEFAEQYYEQTYGGGKQ